MAMQKPAMLSIYRCLDVMAIATTRLFAGELG